MSAPQSRQEEIAPLLRLGLGDPLTASDPDQSLHLNDATTPGSGSKKSNRRRWSPPPLAELQKELPNYEITGLLACGGMGAVYKGTQVTLKRDVAIKVLPPDILNDEDDGPEFADRFKHEAQAMARLNHPNIVSVHDAGQTPDGLLYFIMEFIDGTDVAQLIASEGRVPKDRAVEIITAVCDALAYAHAEGIVHRDIKPSNVMIDRRGVVKVADFGLAKALNRETTALTRTNMALGTPDYMAPEAAIPGIQVDGRADIYAVGVMLYQMLTGRVPRGRFEAASGMVAKLDRRFDAIVDKAMQTDRDKRYSTAIEMKTAIARAATGTLMTAWKPTSSIPVPSGSSRPRLRLAVGAAAVIALGIVIYLQLPRHSQTKITVLPTAPPQEYTSPVLATPPSAADPGVWTNLLENFDTATHVHKGLWSLKDGELAFDHTISNMGSCELPVNDGGGSYDLRIEFTRVERVAGGIAFAIRKGDNGGTIVFDQVLNPPEGPRYAGLASIEGRTDLGDLCPIRERWITPGSRHTLLIQVRDEGLRVVLDDQEAFRWAGDWTSLKQGRGADRFFTTTDGRTPIFGLASKQGGTVYHRIEFRKVPGKDGEKLPPPATSSTEANSASGPLAWTNLLATLDPEKVPHHGRWIMQDRELHLELSTNLGTCDLPVDYDGGNYDLRLRLTRNGNNYRATAIAFQKGTTGGTIIFDLLHGKEPEDTLYWTGLASLSDRTTQNLGGLCPPGVQRITPGPHTILLQVRDEGLRVTLDDQEVFRWTGDWSLLRQGQGEDSQFTKSSVSLQTSPPNRRPIFRLGTLLGGAVYHSVEYRKVTGEDGKKLPPAAPSVERQ